MSYLNNIYLFSYISKLSLKLIDRYPSKSIERYSDIIALSIIYVYIVELLLNRILMRTLIFVPSGPIQTILVTITSVGGLLSLNYIIIASVFLLVFKYRNIYPLAIIMLSLTDLIVKIPVAIISLFIVSILIILIDRKRFPESLFLTIVSIAQITNISNLILVSQILWIIAPIPLISKTHISNLKWSLPVSIFISLIILRNPYIVSQILNLGMGAINPWFIPLAIIIYSLASNRSAYMILLTGPQIQLLNQVLAISSVYIHSLTKQLNISLGNR